MRRSASEIIRNLESRIAKLEKSSHLIGMDDHFPHFEDEVSHEEQLKMNFMRSVNHFLHQMELGLMKVKDEFIIPPHILILRPLSGVRGRGYITERMMFKGVKDLKVVKDIDIAKVIINDHYQITVELVASKQTRDGWNFAFELELIKEDSAPVLGVTISTKVGNVEMQAKRAGEEFLREMKSPNR